MTRICLDTSAYSNFQRGHPGAVEAIDGADWIGVPSVALGELWTGFLRGRQVELNSRQLRAFLDNAAVEVVNVDEDVARTYGEIVVDLRNRGTPLPTNDIWIAAAAARCGAAVLTFDTHFDAIVRVGALVLAAR